MPNVISSEFLGMRWMLTFPLQQAQLAEGRVTIAADCNLIYFIFLFHSRDDN